VSRASQSSTALMRSRVHNRTRDRGGKPIRLSCAVGTAPGPSGKGWELHQLLSIVRVRQPLGQLRATRKCIPDLAAAEIKSEQTRRYVDPPPLKWSDLRYVFDIKEDCNGKEAIQA
jgi:hypothetical protein